MERLPFYSDCVGWPRNLLAALEHLIDNGEDISRDTFLRHVVNETIPQMWYPERRYTWSYSFHRLPDHSVYWFVHSCTEVVFAQQSTILTLNREAA